MKADILERVIAALESGDYEQGKSALHQGGRWCCLGVMCDLAVEDGVVTVEYTEAVPGVPIAHYGEGRDWAYLPEKVVIWAGLEYTGERVSEALEDNEGRGRLGEAPEDTLAAYNDLGAPFTEIAQTMRRRIRAV
jgi:hypothetical protein